MSSMRTGSTQMLAARCMHTCTHKRRERERDKKTYAHTLIHPHMLHPSMPECCILRHRHKGIQKTNIHTSNMWTDRQTDRQTHAIINYATPRYTIAGLDYTRLYQTRTYHAVHCSTTQQQCNAMQYERPE